MNAAEPEPDLVKYQPVATQLPAAGQDTPDNSPPCAVAGGRGNACSRHWPPLHRSASGSSRWPALKYWPTAVQVRGAEHETPFRVADTVPAGTGDGWIRQRVPSQRSVSAVLSPVVPVPNPAAVQARADAHDNPIRPLLTDAPAGLGVAWPRQLLPPQAAAVVLARWLAVSKLPAAVQAVAALQDTAASPVPADRPGFGTAWIRQFVPFHRSASDTVMLVPPEAPRPRAVLIVVAPTAVHAAAAEHDTARNSLPVDPAGLGVAWMRQRVPFHASASSTEAPLPLP